MPKVLVIDDDDAFRGTLVALLEQKGFEVLQAASGAAGIHLARTHIPDLVLCDVNMAGVGRNLPSAALRRHPKIASIPFVLMSGFVSAGETPPGIERGADGFLTKPFTVEKLLSAIEMWLTRPQQVPAEENKSARESRGSAANSDSDSDLLKSLNQVLDTTRSLCKPSRVLKPKEIIEFAGQAHAAAALLHRRIENCLLYAEIERLASDWQHLGDLQEHRTRLRKIVKPAPREKAAASDRSPDLVLHLDDAVVAISADPLKKMVEELLDNALRFSRPGNPVHVQSAIDLDQVALSITDQGCGMTQEQVAQAGGPIPLDQVLLAQHGTGLGLVIARRLAEFHGGNLTIQSEPGRGTTVTLTLKKPLHD